MKDILSILQDYVEELPLAQEVKAVHAQSDPYFQRLCALTTTREADGIWGAAVEMGAAECSADFRRGFAMGVRLWEEIHQIELTR